MATFITIGYGDRAGYERADPSMREAAHRHDARLRSDGALMGPPVRPHPPCLDKEATRRRAV